MGKKAFGRFIRWIRSELPSEVAIDGGEDEEEGRPSTVRLLGFTRIPSSPSLGHCRRSTAGRRPHTLHIDDLTSVAVQSTSVRSSCEDLRHLSAKGLPEVVAVGSPTSSSPGVTRKNGTPHRNGDSAALLLPNENNNCGCWVARSAHEDRQQHQNNNNSAGKKVAFRLPRAAPRNERFRPEGDIFSNGTVLSVDVRVAGSGATPSPSSERRREEHVEQPPSSAMDKSADSIGSCSLDAEASSVVDYYCTGPSPDPSVRTLHSVSIQTPSSLSCANTPETEKKPSYLNLSCTVSGYSDITNYNSKLLRENYRLSKSREVSPNRPHDHNGCLVQSNGHSSQFLTPNYLPPSLSSPSKMGDKKSETIVRSAQTDSYFSSAKTSFMSKEVRNFTSSMLYTDVVDACIEKTSLTRSKIDTSYELKSLSETSIQESRTNGEKAKSFIQQRIERLYGPGALAQGFFISKRQKNQSESENGSETVKHTEVTHKIEVVYNDQGTDTTMMKQSSSTPALPVLRHLRPEFRAQLPIISPKRFSLDNTMQKSTTSPSLKDSTPPTAKNGHDRIIHVNGCKIIEDNKENIENGKPPKLETQISKEHLPAAPQVVLPITNGEAEKIVPKKSEEIKDGHYFLRVLKNETDRLIRLAEAVESELDNGIGELSEDVLGYLRSASGKARLLVTQKMQQFEGLCHKNINQVAGEPFPTTPEDLQGFWDMVMLQVNQVNDLFADLDRLRSNNWVETKPEKSPAETPAPAKTRKAVSAVRRPASADVEVQRKQREAARKRMIEAKRKAMREKQQNDQQIEIFVPESS